MTVTTSQAPRGAATTALTGIFGNGAGVVALIFFGLFSVYGVLQPRSMNLYGLNDLLNNATPLALAAVGGTIVMLTRGFDLSVAGVISLVNVCMATMLQDGPFGAMLGVCLAIAIGAVVGAFNGFLVTSMRLQSIAATLSTMIICSGLAIVVLDAPGGYVPDFISYELTDLLGGVLPVSFCILAITALLWVMLRKTDFGSALFAVGADETAAGLAGVEVRRVQFLAYCLAGAFYGLAGFMLSAVTATGSPSAGAPFLLLMFAAIAMGGTSFAGGYGGPIGSIIGALLLILLQKTLFTLGLPAYYTFVFQGLVMILAVIVGGVSARYTKGRH
ncbi:ABC transporter permease [Pseudosulfitobacter sp. RP-4]